MKSYSCLFGCLAGALLLSFPCMGQQVPVAADASRRAEAVTTRNPSAGLSDDVNLSRRSLEEENAFAPSSAGDDDIGQQLILKETSKVQPFHFQSDAYLFWTDNAAHSSAGEIEDWFYGWRVNAGYQKQLASRIYMDVSMGEDWFRYDKLEALNFESFEAVASLYYIEPRLASSMFFLQYQYQRLTHEFDSLLNSHSVRFGVQKQVLLDRKNSLQFSMMGDWDLETDVAIIKRNEYSADVAWRHRLTHDLAVSLSYRYTYLDYAVAGRADQLHAVGLNLSYTPRKWLEIYGGYNWTLNNSNFSVFDYEASTGGGGLGVRIKF